MSMNRENPYGQPSNEIVGFPPDRSEMPACSYVVDGTPIKVDVLIRQGVQFSGDKLGVVCMDHD